MNPKYLYTFFQTPVYWNNINKKSRGGTLAGFNASMLSKMEIPLPPTPADQDNIASDLERRMAHVEKMRAAALRQKEAIAVMQGAILREVFSYEEGDELPEGWKLRQLKENCFINPSKRKGFTREPNAQTSFVPMEAVDEETGKIAHIINRNYFEISKGYTLFEDGAVLFAKKGDTANLERIVQISLARKDEEKPMLDRLFEYHKAQGNYEKAKASMIKSYEFTGYNSYYAEYKRMKEFLNDVDWEQIEPNIFNGIKDKNVHHYLRICLDKNMNKTVLDILLYPPNNKWGYVLENDFDEFAEKLKDEFPEKIIDYYWQISVKNTKGGNRKTYSVAARYIAKAKNIYIDILKDESKWKQRFSDLKAGFKNRPAFLDEVKYM